MSRRETEREEDRFSHLMASLDQAQHELELPNVRRLLACFESLLAGESFMWDDIFKQPLTSKMDVPHIPETVYTDLVNWITREISDDTLSDFVVESCGYISNSVLGCTSEQQGGEGLSQYCNMSIFAVLALLLRSKPHVLASGLPSQGKQALPLTVWMIKQNFGETRGSDQT